MLTDFAPKTMLPDVFEDAEHDESIHFPRKGREIVKNRGSISIGNLLNELSNPCTVNGKTPIYPAQIFIYWVPPFTGPNSFPPRGPFNQGLVYRHKI